MLKKVLLIIFMKNKVKKYITYFFLGERDENKFIDDPLLIKEKYEGSKTHDNFPRIIAYYYV